VLKVIVANPTKGGAVAFEWRFDVEFGRPGAIEILAGFGELPTP
jgi:hypothetical protein